MQVDDANDEDVGNGVNLTGTLIAIDRCASRSHAVRVQFRSGVVRAKASGLSPTGESDGWCAAVNPAWWSPVEPVTCHSRADAGLVCCSLATAADGRVHETKAEKAARSTRRGKIVKRTSAAADDMFTSGFAVEHGRWMLSTDGWVFVASNSCSVNTSAGLRTYACSGVGADTRLREMLGIPLGESSPKDEEVWEYASKVSHWRGNLDQKLRATHCNNPSHAPPFWCKTEAGPAGALIRDMDAMEAKWLQVGSRAAARASMRVTEAVSSVLLSVLTCTDAPLT